MCEASKVTNDWVVKGCHIHIKAVELRVFPNHKGGLGFKSFFAVTPRNHTAVTEAISMAEKECLPDPQVRKRWIRSLNRAMSYMLSFDGEPSTIANGRMLEFRFLIIALERYTD